MDEITKEFLDWAKAKPADEAFDYIDNLGCAFAQFLNETGRAEKPHVVFDSWYDEASGQRGVIPELLAHALVKGDYTPGDEDNRHDTETFARVAGWIEHFVAEGAFA